MGLARLALVASLAFLVTGCQGEGAPAQRQNEPAPVSAIPPTHLRQELNLSFSEQDVPSIVHEDGVNCARFVMDGAVEILNGTSVATWSPAAPTQSSLSMGFSVFSEQGARAQAQGPSPLRMAIPNASLSDRSGFTAIFVGAPQPGATIQQAVHLAIDLNYTGHLTLSPGGCSVSG